MGGVARWRSHPLYSIMAPLVSMFGGILVWIGVWQGAVDYLHGGDRLSDLAYMLSGLACMVFTSTFIAQAGMKPVAFAPRYKSNILQILTAALLGSPPTQETIKSKVALGIRSLLALLAGICFWLGSYNLFDLFVLPNGGVMRDIGYAITGVFIMAFTANVTAEGAVIAETVDMEAAASQFSKSPSLIIESPVSLTWYFVKATVGLFGSVLYWVGVYNIVDVHMWPYGPERDALYACIGFATMFLVSVAIQREREQFVRMATSYEGLPSISSTLTWQSAHGVTERLVYIIRTIAVMIAGVLAWVGFWNILCYYIVDPADSESDDPDVPQPEDVDHSRFPVWGLYLIYIAVGLVLLIGTNTLTLTAGAVQPLMLIRSQTDVNLDEQDEYALVDCDEDPVVEITHTQSRLGLLHSVDLHVEDS